MGYSDNAPNRPINPKRSRWAALSPPSGSVLPRLYACAQNRLNQFLWRTDLPQMILRSVHGAIADIF